MDLTPTERDPLLTVDDYEAAARARLPAASYDYYRTGADEERTLHRNREAFARWQIWYRTLVDVDRVELATTVLGSRVAMPILVAPTAYHRLAHADGECGTAAATAEVGSLYVASTLATTTLEEVAGAAPAAPCWFQLYVHRDRDFTARLIERAKAAGYRAIALTVDTPVLGRRLVDARNQFSLPPGLVMANLVEGMPENLAGGDGSELARYVAARQDPTLTWRDLEWVVARAAPLPVVVKGVARADDAQRALDHGAAAIWVSNHGGRQLDLAPATLDVLPEVVAAVGDRAEVYVDGGVRSGTHALIALALGARAVFVGRPVLWGLAVGGRQGVVDVLALLRDELARAMRLAGAVDLGGLRDGLVRRGI
jgi:4-hydroxymandelate oxidase